MPAFLRYLLVFVLGTSVGAVGILLTQPGFSVVVTSVPRPAAPVAAAPQAGPAPAPAAVKPAVAPVKPVEPVAVAEAPKPVAPKVEPPPAPVATKEGAAPGLDFAALTEHPVFWPASVVLASATNIPLNENGKRIGEMPLASGAVLQVSKVLANGTLEVRAKGMKFEVDSKLTDFEALVRRKIQEVMEKDAKALAPLVREAIAATPVAPAPVAVPPKAEMVPAPVATEEAPKVVARPAPVTLDDKMNTLFGRRPAPVEKTEPAASPAPAPTPAPAPVEPAPADKTQEKKADLDRRMNGLFGTPAK